MSLRRHLRGPSLQPAVYAGRVACAPQQYLSRRRWARRLEHESEGADAVVAGIDPRTGYTRLSPGDLVGFSLALTEVAGLVATTETASNLLAGRSASGLIQAHIGVDEWRPGPDDRGVTHELLSDSRILACPALLEFALQPPLIRAVTRYLGVLPYIERIGLPLSLPPHADALPAYYTRFHLDNDDSRLVKVFLHADDVGPNDGPLTFLPADTSARVVGALRRRGERGQRGRSNPYGSWTDAEVFEHCDPNELVTLTGPRGAGAMVDLCRCLHYGSRVAPAHRRLELVLSFLRYHRPNPNRSNQLHDAEVGGPAWRRLVLQNPRPRPRDTLIDGAPPRVSASQGGGAR